jgi:hypothetical protein
MLLRLKKRTVVGCLFAMQTCKFIVGGAWTTAAVRGLRRRLLEFQAEAAKKAVAVFVLGTTLRWYTWAVRQTRSES